MSVFERRQRIKQVNRMATLNSQLSVANVDSDEEFFYASEEFETSQGSDKFSSILQGSVSSHLGPAKALRIRVESDYDLHERYMSSEEEPSPSPDSETTSHYGQDDVEECSASCSETADDKENEEPLDPILEIAVPEIALAVPIMSIGKPKLIDITELAPMHKRKRASTDQMLLSRSPIFRPDIKTGRATDRETLAPVQKVARASTPSHDCDATVPSPLVASDPSPRAHEVENVTEEDLETEAQRIIDPVVPQPRLIPRDSINVLRKKQGSVARARRQISRSASKESLAHNPEKPQNKRVRRMQARGADERLTVPFIPAYPGDMP